jgi:hypothetical protein
LGLGVLLKLVATATQQAVVILCLVRLPQWVVVLGGKVLVVVEALKAHLVDQVAETIIACLIALIQQAEHPIRVLLAAVLLQETLTEQVVAVPLKRVIHRVMLKVVML